MPIDTAIDTLQQNGLLQQKLQQNYIIVKELPKTATSIDEMFRYIDGYGKIRFAYFGSKYKEEPTYHTQESYACAIGGIVGLKTAAYHNISANIALSISQDLPFMYNTDKRSDEFLDNNHNSYSYISQSSIDYKTDSVHIMIGRFAIDTPFANTDDIRMSQNTFEGAFGQYNNDQWNLQLFYLTRWAGYDSADDVYSQNEFHKLIEGSRGLIGSSITYDFTQDNSISFYYQNIEKFADIYYIEATGSIIPQNSISIDYGLQYAHQTEKENSGIDGDVYGIMGVGHYKNLSITLAANFAIVRDNKTVTDGFGGGPFFTSLDEATIAAASEHKPGSNVDMYRGGIGYEIPSLYSTIEYAYGYMDLGGINLDEHDIIYTLSIDESWYAEAIFVKYSTDTNELNRAIVRLDYNF